MAKYDVNPQFGSADQKALQQQRAQVANRLVQDAANGPREIGSRTMKMSAVQMGEAHAVGGGFEGIASIGIKPILPSAEKITATTESLREDAKLETREWASTLDKMKKSELAKLLEHETSPFARAIFDLQAQKKLSEKTVNALDKIQEERLTKTPTSSTWRERLRDAAKTTVLGVGAISAFGVTGAAALAGAAMVGAETLYRVYEARKKNEEVKGFLPGAKALGERLNRALDTSVWFIGEEAMKARARMSENAMQLNNAIAERVEDIVLEHKDPKDPELAKRIRQWRNQRSELIQVLDANATEVRRNAPWPELYEGIPWIPGMTQRPLPRPEAFKEEMNGPGTKTLPLSPDYVRSAGESRTIWNGSAAPEMDVSNAAKSEVLIPSDLDVERTIDTLHQPQAEQAEAAPATIPETAPIVAPLDRNNKIDKKVDATFRFQTIAVDGVKGVYNALPAMRAQAETLNARFKSSDPTDPTLSSFLDEVAEEALNLATQARQLRIDTYTADPISLIKRQEEFVQAAGPEADFWNFDPETWAIQRLNAEGIGDPSQPGKDLSQNLDVQHFLKGMISTVTLARNPWRHHDDDRRN